jgi:hypothetical protein
MQFSESERGRVSKRFTFTLIAFGLIVIGYSIFNTTVYLPLFVFGLLIPIGLLLNFIWALRSK